MSIFIPATVVSVPKYRPAEQLFSHLVEAAGQLFEASWKGSWTEPPSRVESFQRFEALLQSVVLRDELHSSQYLSHGQHAQIRMRNNADGSYPVVKIAVPNEEPSRQQIASEHSILLDLQGLGFSSVKVESCPLRDDDGILGFRMAQLYPITPAELRLRTLELGIIVAQLHELCFIHGDISASNVMQDANGELRLIDFGAAGRIGEALPSWHVFRRLHGFTEFTKEMDVIRMRKIEGLDR